MRKVLHISKYYYPFVGGIEQTARDCVNALQGAYEQKVMCFNHKNGDKVEYIDNIEVIRCGCQFKISSQSISFGFGKKLRAIINEYNPDIILFHYPNPFVSHYLLKYIKPNNNLIVYWHLDITKQKILGKLFYNQNHKLLQVANRIIATSPNYIEGSSFLHSYKEKCIVIPSCINENRLKVDELSKELAKTIKKKYNDKIVCLAVGRHVPYKGFEYLIESFRLLDDRFVLCITGKGELTDKLKNQAKGLSNVKFLGSIDDSTLKAYYLTADIFCFSSITKNEAFGLALAEAMYFGLPTVTYNIPGSGVNYVSLNGLTGIEVANRDYKAYADAIIKLGNNVDLRQTYGKNGKQRVIDNFLYSQFNKNISNMLSELFEEVVV